MKKRRWFSLFLSFALLLPLFSLTSADAYEDFTLDAKAGLLIEADTGEILYEKNAHQENFPASLTKVMVALLVFEAIDEGKIALTDSVTATESAFEGLSSDGSTALFFGLFDLVGHGRGRRALAAGVGEDVDGGKAAGLHERKRIGELLLGFAGEADDEVGGDGAVGEEFVKQTDAL